MLHKLVNMLLNKGSFQGRPKGVTPKYSLAPLVPRLSELLGFQVPFASYDLKEGFVLLFFDSFLFCMLFINASELH